CRVRGSFLLFFSGDFVTAFDEEVELNASVGLSAIRGVVRLDGTLKSVTGCGESLSVHIASFHEILHDRLRASIRQILVVGSSTDVIGVAFNSDKLDI